MEKYEYLPNAFWEDGCDDRSVLKCIRMTTLPDGKRKKDILQVRKGDRIYDEVIAAIGVPKIDEETNQRRERKQREGREKRALHEQKKKAAELEDLFNAKLQAFEIPEVKDREDGSMRRRMRKAKSVVELQALTALAVGLQLGYFNERTD